MFTGIVEEVGTVLELRRSEHGGRLRIACVTSLEDAVLGASIAVNGACLTAVELTAEEFSADLSPETLRRTSLGELSQGDRVNLERPLRATGRLDGHFVLGHVDGTGVLETLEKVGEGNWWMKLRLPDELTPYIVSKGSIAVDGISLTIAEIDENLASFAVIPHTYSQTALSGSKPGKRLNLEVDILAKHLAKLISFSREVRFA